jgi:hypothetical protein
MDEAWREDDALLIVTGGGANAMTEPARVKARSVAVGNCMINIEGVIDFQFMISSAAIVIRSDSQKPSDSSKCCSR